MADPVEVLSRLNPIRRPAPTSIELVADALAALSLGLAAAALIVVVALILTRRPRHADPRIADADALPDHYRLPAYLRLLGTPRDGLYRPMPPGEADRLAREARARLEDAA